LQRLGVRLAARPPRCPSRLLSVEGTRLGRLRRVKRPRIYGNETRCRAAVARYIESAEEILDQADGVRKRIAALSERGLGPGMAFSIEEEWGNEVRRRLLLARRNLGPYLQDQFEEVLPTVAGVPPDTGKPRHTIVFANGEPNLRRAVSELRELQDALGVRRGVATTAPPPARFAELHASGLVAEKVIADHAKDMLSPRTPKQLYDAIGSAKELTEATLRAALDRLGESYRPRDDLPTLMRNWRKAVGKLAPPDPQGEDSLDKAQAALASIVNFLAEWRSAYGRGHGRPQYPPGLTARHARLAADAAETCIRFIVTTMDDLQLLAPRAANGADQDTTS
jgi:hypothetical protein